jgi:CubicO group peptidase (beta-lactamase class C family)
MKRIYMKFSLPEISLCATALLALACSGTDPGLPTIGRVANSDNSLSWLRTVAIDRALDYRVWSGARAGFVALVAREGRVVYARTTGFANLEEEIPMDLETRFHLASMTKPITAVAAMILVEQGRLSLDEPVAKFIPAFAESRVVTDRNKKGEWGTRPLSEPILVRHLLTFTSGIGGYAETDDALDQAWRSPDIEVGGLGSLADRVNLIPGLPLYEDPGERWRYGWSADVLARVIERASGEPYETFLHQNLLDPLGMTSTSYAHAIPGTATLARLYTHDAEGSLVHDPQFDVTYGRGWTSGGGGLVSTAPDYMRFALMLARGGSLGEVKILKAETVAEMTRLQVPGGVLADVQLEGLGWGLGFSVIADDSKTMMPSTNGDYWWSGRFGTHFWISPKHETVVVVMQQTERGPYSDLPITPSLVQALAMP